MNTKTDFSDALADDFLRETATRFFETRKHLEDMIKSFEKSVDELREKETLVAQRAGLLNFLLLQGKASREFYEVLELDAESFAVGTGFTDQVLPEKLPFSLNRQHRFVKLVLLAYDALRKECHAYMHGRYYMDPEQNGQENVTGHYHEIETMAELINEKVEQINQDMSPMRTLQYVRKFHPEMEAMERITGSGGEFWGTMTSSIDHKLAYSPIDFERLNLKSYPDMPPLEAARSMITGFAKNLYLHHRNEIRTIMENIIKTIKHHQD
jgi:hypothetical protein